MNDKESPLVDYEPSDGDDDLNEPSAAEIAKAAAAQQDAERKEETRRRAEKLSAITGKPISKRSPSPMGHQGPRRRGSNGNAPFRRIGASNVVTDKVMAKDNPAKHNAESYHGALLGACTALSEKFCFQASYFPYQ